MHDIGHQVHVTLPSSTPAVLTERLAKRKLEQQVLQVVDGETVGGVPNPCTLLQVGVVPVPKLL